MVNVPSLDRIVSPMTNVRTLQSAIHALTVGLQMQEIDAGAFVKHRRHNDIDVKVGGFSIVDPSPSSAGAWSPRISHFHQALIGWAIGKYCLDPIYQAQSKGGYETFPFFHLNQGLFDQERPESFGWVGRITWSDSDKEVVLAKIADHLTEDSSGFFATYFDDRILGPIKAVAGLINAKHRSSITAFDLCADYLEESRGIPKKYIRFGNQDGEFRSDEIYLTELQDVDNAAPHGTKPWYVIAPDLLNKFGFGADQRSPRALQLIPNPKEWMEYGLVSRLAKRHAYEMGESGATVADHQELFTIHLALTHYADQHTLWRE